MPITTRTVVISTEAALGAALPKARVRFVLSAADSQNGELIVPAPIWADLDDLGSGSKALWPNVLGANGTHYAVTVYDRYSRVRLEAKAVVPDQENVPLLTCLQLQPTPTLDAAQLAVQQAQAAAAQAQAAAASILAQYVHTQGTPAETWTINHNLGRYPSVTVEDSVGDDVEGEVHYDSQNTVRLVFSAAFGGRAILN